MVLLLNPFAQSTKSAIALWNSLLKPQTPFDINIVIKALSTGQLALAQTTQFNEQGRPNGGTFLIDDTNATQTEVA